MWVASVTSTQSGGLVVTSQTGPEQPRWYRSPSDVAVPIESIVRVPNLEEVAIRIKLDGITKTATVPSEIVDEEKMVVRGTLIGEIGQGDVVLISLPPSSMGGTILQLKRDLLPQLVS